MSLTATYQLNVSGPGVSITSSTSITADAGIPPIDTTLAVGQAGTLSTRTSDTAGTLTLGVSHGITTGSQIDIYWAAGMCYSATVGTVSGTSVPFTLAHGDVLPAQTTAIVACVQTVLDVDFDGDNLELIAACCTSKAHLTFMDAAGGASGAPAVLYEVDLAAALPWSWADGITAGASPLAGNAVNQILVSNGSSTVEGNLKITGLQNVVT